MATCDSLAFWLQGPADREPGYSFPDHSWLSGKCLVLRKCKHWKRYPDSEDLHANRPTTYSGRITKRVPNAAGRPSTPGGENRFRKRPPFIRTHGRPFCISELIIDSDRVAVEKSAPARTKNKASKCINNSITCYSQDLTQRSILRPPQDGWRQ